VIASNAAVPRPLAIAAEAAASTKLRTAQAVPGDGKPVNATATEKADVKVSVTWMLKFSSNELKGEVEVRHF
jgi:hypothetical protein